MLLPATLRTFITIGMRSFGLVWFGRARDNYAEPDTPVLERLLNSPGGTLRSWIT
jgi:hypothetical protein